MHPPRRRGPRDQAAREAIRDLAESGNAICPKCGNRITPGQEWDAGHLADLATGGHPDGKRVPEHSSCNRSAGAKLGAQIRARPRRRLDKWL